MKRHPVLAHFSREHHAALITSQFIRKGAPKYKGMPETIDGKKEYVIRFFDDHLRDHFSKEETILFANTKGITSSIDELIEELIKEHRTAESLIKKLKADADAEATLDELGALMESHIRKEERILFQQLQEKLPEEELMKLEKLMNASTES